MIHTLLYRSTTKLIPQIYSTHMLKLVEHNQRLLEYTTVDIMSDHSEQQHTEGSDSTQLHLLEQCAQDYNVHDPGGLAGCIM